MSRLPAFAVDGAEVTGRLLRTVAYAATSGQTGVVTPESMKVTGNGAAVSIAPGAAVAATRYVSSPAYNSYVLVSDSTATVSIPATGAGSGAVRYIIARADDPEYGGQGDPSEIFWRYEQVGSVTNLPYPFVPLARINQPPSTTTITNAMITDLRSVATPRRTRDTYERKPAAVMSLTSATYVDFPQLVAVDVLVPEWATKALIRVDMLDIIHTIGNVDGNLTIQLGSGAQAQARHSQRRYDKVWAGATSRHDLTIVAAYDIPLATRGTTQRIKVQGTRLNGGGALRADTNSQLVYDIEFMESLS